MHSPAGGKDGAFIISVCYSGPAGDADRVLAPLRKLGNRSRTPSHRSTTCSCSAVRTSPIRATGASISSRASSTASRRSWCDADRRLPARSAARHGRLLPALRWCDRPRGAGGDGVSAPPIEAQHVRGRHVGHRARRRAARQSTSRTTGRSSSATPTVTTRTRLRTSRRSRWTRTTRATSGGSSRSRTSTTRATCSGSMRT